MDSEEFNTMTLGLFSFDWRKSFGTLLLISLRQSRLMELLHFTWM